MVTVSINSQVLLLRGSLGSFISNGRVNVSEQEREVCSVHHLEQLVVSFHICHQEYKITDPLVNMSIPPTN